MAVPEVLILGGTAEAAALARRLAADGRFAPLTSLAGLTARPVVTGARRQGGFGGAAGLRDFLHQRRPAALIDATHPFAQAMATNAAQAAAAAGVPLLRLQRPAWRPRPGDYWRVVPDLPAAAALLAPLRSRVFLSLGTAHLAPFARLRRPWFLVRAVDRPAARSLPRCRVVVGRGPFTQLGELGLLRRHRIDLVVARNSGGSATYAKMLAARTLRLPVVMVARPVLPDVATVTDVEGAIGWLDQWVARGVT